MSVKKLEIVRFAPRNGEGFYDTVKKNIDNYFKENNIDSFGNSAMRWKTLAMLSLFFVPYIFIVTGLAAFSPIVFFTLWFMMGLGMVGIGCSVHHDSNHGSYSDNKTVNKVVGDIVNVVGGYDVTWRIQHNILHHTYTNIVGLDEDIDVGFLMRFSPHSKKYSLHRYQHIYAWFLYCLLTLQWVTYKDYRLLFLYEKKGLLRKEKITLRKALLELSFYKILYFTYALVLPIIFSGMPWYYVVIGFLILHFVAGLALSCIFQLAHVMEGCDFPNPPDDRKMENNWAVHQLLTTTNFSPRSRFVFWFVGGLNHQIEHHLFPHICHIHYPKIAKIVKNAALAHGLPYQVQPTFAHALVQHGKMLRKLGKD
ncbi:MAG TPA: acyl-CoA desaturase [Flavipsychrobacter sp.]|nr:acyl-CoA desaturase [Flavipsychrobacter sp.]